MQNSNKTNYSIEDKKTYLGIELGSTRIKAVLIDGTYAPIASGSHDWENKLENGYWTYSLESVWNGIEDCLRSLADDVKTRYSATLSSVGTMGFSAMMHGYIALDKDDNLLVPFRTWRNTTTGGASEKLTELFNYNIPQRWSIAHLYQAMLSNEGHVAKIDKLMTLAAYVHWKLTGEHTVGIGEASGMFPIDIETGDYDNEMLDKFQKLVDENGYIWKIRDILPSVKSAGEQAGVLTEEGAKLIDKSGSLKPGIPLCPAEGDAGTGMVATNSIAKRTGNVSAGTSIFAMVVLENKLSNVYPEIDLVTTPCGDLVAMVHCNNCSSDIDAWANIFKETAQMIGIEVKRGAMLDMLYAKALEGDADCGELTAINYFSGEHVTGFTEGRPLFVRTANSKFNLANFMRTNISTALGALKTGLDILFLKENVRLENMNGHGGLFKAKETGQRIMASAINTPVAVMKTAGDGGPWGMAILSAYAANKGTQSLAEFLEAKVFANSEKTVVLPIADEVEGFKVFMERYKKALKVEKSAIENL
ncbi:MAG: FGGY family carbohydrate kinase [Oscillospiraceae bacterium]